MDSVYCLIVITQERYEESYKNFFKSHSIMTCFEAFADASTQEKSLDYLGVEDMSQVIFYAVIKGQFANSIMDSLVKEMGIAVSGNGIAVLIPVKSISGESSLKYLTRGQFTNKKDTNKEEEMTETNKEVSHVLVTAVAEKGFSEMVIDALNTIGIERATIVKAKTVANNAGDDFLGIKLADEKEVIHIVVKKDEEDKVIKAIMKNAGMESEAHTAVFSLPVSRVEGL